MNTIMKTTFLVMIGLLGASCLVVGQGIVVDTFSSNFGSRIKVEDKTACGFDLFASTTNSLGGIKKVGSFDYFDPNGGSAFNQDEVRLSNTASTSGKITFSTMRTNSTINTMEFRGLNSPNATALLIKHSGNLTLDLKANGNMAIAGTLTQNSDIRLKKNIVALQEVLPSLSEISAYNYNWNEEKRGDDIQLGLIAQEVQAQYPELVTESEDGTLSVAYANFTAVLLQATKELHEIVEKQGIEIANLKKQIAK